MSPNPALVNNEKCVTRGCVYYALPNDTHCRNHSTKPPEVPKSPEPAEFEIVKMAAVPQFKIQNARTFSIAKAICTLQPDHALKVKVEIKKQMVSLAASVKNYGTKLGIIVKYRTAPGVIYFWKEAKGGGK